MDRPSSHSQRGPYSRKEGRKSLLSKVKDSVKDMLSPSWLSDLVSSVKKETPSDSPEMGEQQMYISPVSTPTGIPQTGMPQQQLAQANPMPFQAQGMPLGNGQPRMVDFGNRGPGLAPGEQMSPFQQPMIPPPVSEFTSSQLPLARLTEKSDSVLANDDSVSQRSDGSKSTSGCSSMIPQSDARRRESGLLEKRKAAEPELFSTGNSPPSPTDQPSKRQRLQVSVNTSMRTWTRGLGDSFSQQQRPAVVNRPSFNATLFGSPVADDSSLLGSSFHESSFYPGKTTYGGRSSLSFRGKRNKVDLNQSLPSRLSIPVKSFMKAKPKANQSKVAVTSSTAKRILEALDRIPTPLNDAKRIPLSVPRHWTESPSFFTRDKPSPSSGPPKEKLNVSSLATISQNRQVSFSPVRRSAEPSTSQRETRPMPLPSREDTVILGGPGAPSGKMRRDKSYHRGSAAISNKPVLEEDDTEILPPNLTTDFTLPVSSMPKFNFAAAASAKPAASAASTPSKPALNFTFSSPIAETVPVNKPRSPETQGGFQFSSPISVDKQPASSNSSGSSKPFSQMPVAPVASELPKVPAAGYGFSSPAANKSSNMEYSFSSSAAPKPKAKVNGPSTTSSTGSGMQPASELKQGSVMDVLGGGSSMASKPVFGGAAPELKQGSVMDILGGSKAPVSTSGSLLNGPSSSPLFGKKPDADQSLSDRAALKQPSSTASSLPPLSSMFSSSGWNCDVCLVKNKADMDKCVACQSDKPRTAALKQKTDKPATVASSAAPLGTLFSSSGWTCNVCLVKNKADLNNCLACQSAKPAGSGSQGKTDNVKSAPPLSAVVKQTAGWTCDVCLVKNKTEDIKCVACQSAKPGGGSSLTSGSGSVTKLGGQNDLLSKFKAPVGQWECEVCLVRNKPELTACAACQTPKPLKSFKHPPGDWTCDTCLVVNKQASVKCVACNYQRPGPPRTQAVPSCVNTLSQSKNSGFGGFSTTNKKIDTDTSGGGFKFGDDSKKDTGKGGFTFGSSSTSDTSGSLSGTGGFKFGAPTTEDKTSTPSAGGFKFGATAGTTSGAGGFSFGAPTDSKSQSSTGGFKFGSSAPSSSEQNSGLSQDTASTAASVASSGGFKFGAPVVASTNSVSSENSTVVSSSSLSSGIPGGFSFGQTKPEVPPQATTSVPGGFTFKPSDSVVSSKSSGSVTEQTSSIDTSQSIGGFNFSATSKSDSQSSTNVQTSSVTQNSVGGFSFTASKSTENSLAAGTPTSQPVEKKAGFGGFSFGASTSTNTSQPASGFGGFNFAQKPADSLAGQTSSKPTTSLKRDRDEDSGATGAKKSFTFGASAGSSSATPFQFGAANSTPATTAAKTSASSTPFVFGQTAGSGTSTFNFSAGKTEAAPTPVFGAASTATQSGTTAPAFGSGMAFNFTGQKTEAPSTGTTAPVFAFGAQSTQQPSTGTTPAFGGFSSTPSTFGASSTPAFGGNTPSSTPAFGAKPPAFGSANTNSTAPAFGGTGGFNFKADNNSNTTAPAAPAQQPNSVFQFGAKPAESSQPGGGFNFNPAGLGSQPSFNFGASSTPGTMAFSATSGGGIPQTGDRKIKKAVRKIRR